MVGHMCKFLDDPPLADESCGQYWEKENKAFMHVVHNSNLH
jgi:hypothetical protein